MASSDKTEPKKDKKDKKKGGKKRAEQSSAGQGLSVAAHPRASASVRRAKGLGGIAFFVIVAYYSYKADVPVDQVALRALIGGIAGYMLAWMCAVTVWRQLVLAEVKAAIESGRATLETTPEPDAVAAVAAADGAADS